MVRTPWTDPYERELAALRYEARLFTVSDPDPEAQGVPLQKVAQVEEVAIAAEGTFSVLTRTAAAEGAATATGSRSVATIIRHQLGNLQVFINGQRWHVPKNKSVKDIPDKDPVGDQLQEAALRAAREWHPGRMSPREANAVNQARAQGKHWKANLLEREARGRFVHQSVANQFRHLRWNSKSVDAVDPATGYRYELLTRTASNMERHGRRMAEELFRMIGF